MEALRIQATIKTPEILFDPTNQVFEIKGKSVPDDAEEFYTEALQWFDDYVANHQDKAIAFTSLGQLRYLSALQYMDVIVGNSSSGLIEVPSFGTYTINIGDRQRGRVSGESVINCSSDINAITNALKTVSI